jgi:hypothetical protein
MALSDAIYQSLSNLSGAINDKLNALFSSINADQWTALSNTESNTFTPEFADANSGGNQAASVTATGEYARSGDVVTVIIKLNNINTTGMTGVNDIFIRNLPFRVASNSNAVLGLVEPSNITYTGNLLAYGVAGQTYMKIVDIASSTSPAYLTVAAVNAASSDLKISITYRTDV